MKKQEALTATATCGNRAPTSEYICERAMGHAGDHSARAKSSDFPMTVEWSETNEPETAFQGMVREYLHAAFPSVGYLTMDWKRISLSIHNSDIIARLTKLFNATLDLASKAAYDHRYREDVQRAIAALKEPTPDGTD